MAVARRPLAAEREREISEGGGVAGSPVRAVLRVRRAFFQVLGAGNMIFGCKNSKEKILMTHDRDTGVGLFSGDTNNNENRRRSFTPLFYHMKEIEIEITSH